MDLSQKAVWNVFFHTSEIMSEIENSSAQLAVASPPFTNHPDGKTLNKRDYNNFIIRVFSEVYRVLEPGGILVTINTDLRDHALYNDGHHEFDGLVWHKHSTMRETSEEIGFRCTDTKIWAKSLRQNVYRYTFAYIQFFEKPGGRGKRSLHKTIAKEFGPDVWLLERGTYRRDGNGFVFRDAIHPEIVRRCIEQLTAPGDLVISPFTGSGTIIAVAKLMGRRSIGYEINRNLEPMIIASIKTPSRFSAYRDLLK